MNVLGLRVDFDRLAAQPMKRPAHVSMEVGAEVVGQARLPAFGGEDKVSIDLGKRLWHSFAVLAPFQGAFGSLNGSPGHRPDGLSPGLGSTGLLGRKRQPAINTDRKSLFSAIKH